MKKLMMAAALCVTSVVFAEETAVKDVSAGAKDACACAAKDACDKGACPVAADAAKTAKEAKKALAAERRAKRDEFNAKLLGLSVEEFNQLSKEEKKEKLRAVAEAKKAERQAAAEAKKAERQAKMDARDKAAAEKAGKTLEEYRAARKAKQDVSQAKFLGITPEEFAKLTPEERKAKFSEKMAEKRAAAKAAREAKKAAEAAKPAEVPAAK